MRQVSFIKENGTKYWWISIIIALIGVLIMHLIGIFFLLSIFMVLFNNIWTESIVYSYISEMSQLLGFAAILLFIVICNYLIHGRSISVLGFHYSKFFRQYLTGFLCGISMLIVVVTIATLFGGFEWHISSHIHIWMILGYLVGFMIQGLTEEIVCRGYIQMNISARWGMWVGVIINSIIFALLHLGNSGISIRAMLSLLCFGILMSLLFWLTESIWFVGAIHTAWNFVLGPILGIEVSGTNMTVSLFNVKSLPYASLINGGSFGLEASIFTIILLLVMSIYAYSLIKKKKYKI